MYLFPFTVGSGYFLQCTSRESVFSAITTTSTRKASGGRGHQVGVDPGLMIARHGQVPAIRAGSGRLSLPEEPSRLPGVKALTPNTSLKTI